MGLMKMNLWKGESKFEKIKLIFAGTLYPNVNKYISHFKKSLEYLRVNDKDLFDKIEVSFYGPNNYKNFDFHNCVNHKNNLN